MSDWDDKNTPNPGSAEAMEKGCACPVLDNARGRGAWGTSGNGAVFCVTHGCPLHGTTQEEFA